MMLRTSFLMSFCVICLIIAGCGKDPIEPGDINYSTSEYCDNSCYFADDGDCDDGGYGSASSLCKYGTDCKDCGPRVVKEVVR